MISINIPMPTSCDSCPFKGARLCYITVWLGMEYREVPEEGRAEWCPMEEVEDMTENSKCPMVDNCHDETTHTEGVVGNVTAWRPLPEPYTEGEA